MIERAKLLDLHSIYETWKQRAKNKARCGLMRNIIIEKEGELEIKIVAKRGKHQFKLYYHASSKEKAYSIKANDSQSYDAYSYVKASNRRSKDPIVGKKFLRQTRTNQYLSKHI